MHEILNIILHLTQHLSAFVSAYGVWAYVILFFIIFCETGLVVTPFLPGDTLLFAAGALAGSGALNIHLLFVLLFLAALFGDNVNYGVGRTLGHKLFQNNNSKIFKKSYLEKAHHFYQKYGGKTIIIARFLPIFRTFVPFVAGLARMQYKRFIGFSVCGALLWVGVVSYLGFWFGNIPEVRHNFVYVIFAIIVISILPALFEYFRAKRRLNLPRKDSAR